MTSPTVPRGTSRLRAFLDTYDVVRFDLLNASPSSTQCVFRIEYVYRAREWHALASECAADQFFATAFATPVTVSVARVVSFATASAIAGSSVAMAAAQLSGLPP